MCEVHSMISAAFDVSSCARLVYRYLKAVPDVVVLPGQNREGLDSPLPPRVYLGHPLVAVLGQQPLSCFWVQLEATCMTPRA